MNREKIRLEKTQHKGVPWKKWGPYLSERQWGTVREDYSAEGAAWDYTTHDMARSKAYRWGEEGIGGICDDQQILCFSLALWNGRDPILKERLFGLNGNEGNHGEDVKELYYYLDSTPTHSYMKMLYKYPQSEFPYAQLVAENRRRGKRSAEFELIDTGIFAERQYFDVFIEYAKAEPDDILIRITAWNRGTKSAFLSLIPQLWFRNRWSWGGAVDKPMITLSANGLLEITDADLGACWLAYEKPCKPVFCDNETNYQQLYNSPGMSAFCKDGINDYLIHGLKNAVNPAMAGTKAGIIDEATIPGGAHRELRLRLSATHHSRPFLDFDKVFSIRLREADVFYQDLQQELPNEDACRIQRQAFAGMLWSKQFYYYHVGQWLEGDAGHPPPPPGRKQGRNHDWIHLNNADIISMPDKWEYPWYAAWDLAFHCLPLAAVDPEFAKQQLLMMTREWYMHPNGQLPAYEWAFGDVNPPVHAWAAWRVYKIDKKRNQGSGDTAFLESIFHKLLLNFTWWVNRKDVEGHNIFQGGFLGLDNIGVFDRSATLPTGGHIEQADGTSWMAMYSLNLMRIALELAIVNPVYQSMATKFFEHFLYIAAAMANLGAHGISLWDDEDKFFYDVLHAPGHGLVPLKVRSMVGLIPLFAVETLEPQLLDTVPEFKERLEWFLQNRPDMANLISRWTVGGLGERRLLSLLRGHRMKCLLKRMLDESEFFSAYGIRALSKYHRDHPYEFRSDGNVFRVAYQPAESDSGLFGGNSNWRGPIWFPLNFLIIESLQKFHHYYGDDFKVECPTNSGNYHTINEIANEIGRRLTCIFLRDESGRRPVFGDNEILQTDPHFRDYLLFYEYFHGDDGRGVGASHQTGWTGLVTRLLHPREEGDPNKKQG